MSPKISIPFADLTRATFLERPNRFIVRCSLEESNKIVEAHLADPGRLLELLVPGAPLYLRQSSDPKRKTKWSVILVEADGQGTLVSLQSTLVNSLTALVLQEKALPELAQWEYRRQEYSYAGARWDFLLQNEQGKQLLLEVKSCSLVHSGLAMFPDAVTERGKRHVQKLTELHRQGELEAAILFVVQRSDAKAFRPASHIDPNFSKALVQAFEQGVQVFVYNCQVHKTGIDWGRALPINFS